MSLALAFALYAAISIRYGNKIAGFTWAELAMLDAINAAKPKLPTTD